MRTKAAGQGVRICLVSVEMKGKLGRKAHSARSQRDFLAKSEGKVGLFATRAAPVPLAVGGHPFT
jgi:hypothetical protein